MLRQQQDSMEVTAFCIRLSIFILLSVDVQNSDAAFRIIPTKLQLFQYESVSFHCEGLNDSSQLRGIRNTEGFISACNITSISTVSCTIQKAYPADSGEYWCETKEGKKSNRVNITITVGSVILESPVIPVMEGDCVTLHCRNKTTSSHLTADFYKNGLFMRSSSTGEITIHSVSKSDEGLYKCNTSDVGESPESRLTVRVLSGSVILESPVIPAMEGDNVTLRCRYKTTSSREKADFYKNGLFMRSSSTGEITIHSISKSDEGFYKCNISDVGESPESRLTVRVGSVILESPVIPVMEGDCVTLHCRNKTTSSCLTADFYKNGLFMRSSSTGEITIHSVSKSDEGLYKCSISDVGESPESRLTVRVLSGSVILESPVIPAMEGDNVTLRCRYKTTSSHLTADFYKNGLFMRSSSTGEITIHSVSKSDEGFYKCNISDVGESPESRLTVRALDRETCPSSDHSFYVLLLLRTVFTIVMVPLLLLLVGLLHCGKLRVTQK
ncbi:Fc receptor-like protein 5 [Thunnus maccoyii]|uniref:Fc receptor-like protein 5 n=1 Tax=Thunnus maccoyii TaxID=8240 RepID=UPI001C4BD17A|nr:Fc receptor-like protein 5 [Thunnus maccoyii]